ncbi:type 2 periplasmic-binding domain-containing protein [Paracoccus aminophilus]|uniref:Solute-binding protein family 3/N-terminal domain-containing protein n=1 Tax=Paracoccus aminophilus JCM 7686 TaxID=1367847 RepID=S5XY80_PARAH|nr:hypothetical protein [Paracoccus aminophilus]AGT08410.1 hypothetical protein JCM7686_1309 [Paracoccus aminophilus JCM 7686]
MSSRAPLIRPLGLAVALCLGAPALAAEPGTSAPNEALRVALPPGPPEPVGVEARAYTEDGIAPAFARDLAKALGRKLQSVPVSEAHLRLSHGASEGLATGYRSGLSVAMRSDTDIRSWDQIKGRTVCFTETNSAARQVILDRGAVPMPQRAPALSLVKLRTGDCDAALHEAVLLDRLFALPDWQKFSASLPPLDARPLVLTAITPEVTPQLSEALTKVSSDKAWQARTEKWARNVAFEVWLEQDAPDCH